MITCMLLHVDLDLHCVCTQVHVPGDIDYSPRYLGTVHMLDDGDFLAADSRKRKKRMHIIGHMHILPTGKLKVADFYAEETTIHRHFGGIHVCRSTVHTCIVFLSRSDATLSLSLSLSLPSNGFYNIVCPSFSPSQAGRPKVATFAVCVGECCAPARACRCAKGGGGFPQITIHGNGPHDINADRQQLPGSHTIDGGTAILTSKGEERKEENEGVRRKTASDNHYIGIAAHLSPQIFET